MITCPKLGKQAGFRVRSAAGLAHASGISAEVEMPDAAPSAKYGDVIRRHGQYAASRGRKSRSGVSSPPSHGPPVFPSVRVTLETQQAVEGLSSERQADAITIPVGLRRAHGWQDEPVSFQTRWAVPGQEMHGDFSANSTHPARPVREEAATIRAARCRDPHCLGYRLP